VACAACRGRACAAASARRALARPVGGNRARRPCMQHSADKQADIRPFAAVCACFTASACTTACSLALPGCAVPPRTAAGHVVQALECTCPCRVRRRISAAQSVARDDVSQAAGGARARYFHYVRQEMLKNFASGTQTCGMPMTLPRLVELVRASRSAQLHRVSVADSACPGVFTTELCLKL